MSEVTNAWFSGKFILNTFDSLPNSTMTQHSPVTFKTDNLFHRSSWPQYDVRSIKPESKRVLEEDPRVVKFGLRLSDAITESSMKHAASLFREMQTLGVPRNNRIYSTLLHGFSLSKNGPAIDWIVREMEFDGIAHDEYSLTILINHYSDTNQIEKIEPLLALMFRRAIRPNVVTCTTILKVYKLQNDFKGAFRFAEWAVNNKIEDINSDGFFSHLLRIAVGSLNEQLVMQTIGYMKKLNTPFGFRIYSTLIKFYGETCNIKMVSKLYAEACAKKCSCPDLDMVMIDILVKMDRMREAGQIFAKIRQEADFSSLMSISDNEFDCHDKTAGFCLLVIREHIEACRDELNLTIVTGKGVHSRSGTLYEMRTTLKTWLKSLYPKLDIQVPRDNAGCLIIKS